MDGDAEMRIQPAAFDSNTGEREEEFLLWHQGGKAVWGRMASNNTSTVQIGAKHRRRGDEKRTVIRVEVSVPRLVREDNFHPANYEDADTAVFRIGRRLEEIGIKTNLQNSILGRVDLCKRPQMKERFLCYHPLYKQMKAQRVQERDYGSGYLWSNKAFAINAYDKIAEMRDKKLPVAHLPQNVQSMELRLKQAQKVQSTMGFRTLNDLMQNFDHVAPCYHKVLKKQLFRASAEEVQVGSVEGIKAELQLFIDDGVRFPFQCWLEAVAFQRGIGDYDAALKAVEEVAPNKMSRSNWKKKLQIMQVNAQRMSVIAPSTRTLGELYDELRTKVLSTK